MSHTMARTGPIAESYVGRPWKQDECEKWCRTVADCPPEGASAIKTWTGAKLKIRCQPEDAPRGAWCIAEGGEFGHAFYSAGSGRSYTTDYAIVGKVGEASTRTLMDAWNKTFLGYILILADGTDLRATYTVTAKTVPVKSFSPHGKFVTVGHLTKGAKVKSDTVVREIRDGAHYRRVITDAGHMLYVHNSSVA